MKRDEFRSGHDDPIVKSKISDDECEQIKQFCRSKISNRAIFVINDLAEHGVKFMKDYNRILTHDEEETLFILQVVDSYRKTYGVATTQLSHFHLFEFIATLLIYTLLPFVFFYFL